MNPIPNHMTVFILEDDPIMAECIARAAQAALTTASITPRPARATSTSIAPTSLDVQTFPDALSATAALADQLPGLIILDILLNGPDGFAFLNELISYPDTARIPVIIVTSLNLAQHDLSHYGVRAILNKDTMTPSDIARAVRDALVVPPSPPAPAQPASAVQAAHPEGAHAC